MEFTENKELLAKKVQELTDLNIVLCRLFIKIAVYEGIIHPKSDVDDFKADSKTVLSIINNFDSSFYGSKPYDLYRSYKHTLYNENLPTWFELSRDEKTIWHCIECEMMRYYESKFKYKPIGSTF